MGNNHNHSGQFPGFPAEPVTNYWPYPRALNGWWHTLTPTEQKVLDYILRHTWGYRKTADSISYSQFVNGIIKKDGTVIDTGTGIKNEKTVRKALRGLEAKGFIITRHDLGGCNTYGLKINSYQELVPVPNNGNSDLPNSGNSHPSQSLVATINDLSIKNNNTLSATQNKKGTTYKEEISQLINHLSKKLGNVRFPNYGKQAKFAKAMLFTGYSLDDICWAIDTMLENKWWRENSFDMKNVADEIPKLMTRTFKEEDK